MTTTLESLPEPPKILKVNEGVIHIPLNPDHDSFAELEDYTRKLNHLLSLLPSEDKIDAEFDDDGFDVHTTSISSLKYAVDNYFLCDFCTLMYAIIDHYGDDHCGDCLDEIVDFVMENFEYTSQILSDGVYLVRDGEG